jgi:type IV pilus assembly protein PilM
MAGKVISIEMGFSITKVCELDYQVQNPKVYNSFVIETPQGVLAEDGTVNCTEAFADEFRKKLNERGMRSKQVVFSISSSKIANREVKLPFVKESRLPMLIRSNAADYFPIDLTSYELSHIVLGIEGEEDNKKYRLMLLAAPKELLDSYRAMAKILNLEIAAMDYVANSVYNIVKRNSVEGTDMIVKVDERSALVLILEAGSIVLSRNVPYGIDQAIYAIMENEVFGKGLSYHDAIDLSRRKACIHKSMEENSTDTADFADASMEDISWARKDVTNCFSSLAGGVARVLDYWNSRNSASVVQKIYLTGLGGDFSGLSKLMTNEIGTKVKVLSNINGINLDKGIKDVSFGEYITCIGAAIQPLGFNDNEEKQKKKGLGKADQERVGMVVLIAGIVIATALIAASVIPYHIQKNVNESLKDQITALQPAYETYALYKQAEADNSKMMMLDSSAESRLDDLRAFLEEMEEKMPSTLRVLSLSAGTDGITMEVTVETKEEVAKTIEQFKTFDSLSFVDTTAITVSEDDASGEKNTFSVMLQYQSMEQETVEE